MRRIGVCNVQATSTVILLSPWTLMRGRFKPSSGSCTLHLFKRKYLLKLTGLFRTIRYHPDKVTQPELRPAAEAFYIHLKQARDTLVDPVKRFAYDRFGPDMLEWKQCTTIHDYVFAGATRMAPLYIGSLVFLVVSGFQGFLEAGRYV